jgi:hypothetical protein
VIDTSDRASYTGANGDGQTKAASGTTNDCNTDRFTVSTRPSSCKCSNVVVGVEVVLGHDPKGTDRGESELASRARPAAFGPPLPWDSNVLSVRAALGPNRIKMTLSGRRRGHALQAYEAAPQQCYSDVLAAEARSLTG